MLPSGSPGTSLEIRLVQESLRKPIENKVSRENILVGT
jgi:hypothetical protein